MANNVDSLEFWIKVGLDAKAARAEIKLLEAELNASLKRMAKAQIPYSVPKTLASKVLQTSASSSSADIQKSFDKITASGAFNAYGKYAADVELITRAIINETTALNALASAQQKVANTTARLAGQFSKYDTGAGVMGDKMLGPSAPTPKQRLGMDVASMGAMPKSVDETVASMRKLQAANPTMTFTEVGSAMRKAGTDAKLVSSGMNKIAAAAKPVSHSIDFIRTALGALLAVGVFQVLAVIQQIVTKIVESASQAEQALIKLSVAEKSISAAGVDIVPQDLLDIADKVASTYESVSKIDASKMISNLAVLTKDLKLTAAEYEQLAMAIPLVAQQAGVSIDSATEQVITGLTKSGRGWADLGITVDAAIIQQKAVAMNLVASADAYKNLTAEQKQQVEVLALLQILEENVSANLAEQDKYNNSLAGSQAALNAEWEDFLAALGKLAAPTIIQFLQELTAALKSLNEWIDKNSESLNELAAKWAGIQAVTRESFGPFGFGYMLVTGKAGEVYDEAYQQAKDYKDNLENLSDTPTNLAPQVSFDDEAESQIAEEFDKLRDKIEEENRKLEQDKFEAGIDLQIKLEDIDIDYADKVEDIIRDYNQKITDINTDYRNKVADINRDFANREAQAAADYRQEQINAEQDYQNDMLKMREDYLMDLEEALHERDARQVLRLMKQYALDKQQAARDHALDKQQRAQAFQQEMAQLRSEKAQRLAEARQEQQQKLEEAQTAKEREMEEAALWREREREEAQRDYQRKLEDLQRHYNYRLQELGRALQAEYNLTAQQAAALRSMLSGNLAAYSQYISSMVAQTNAAIAGMGGTASQPSMNYTTTSSGYTKGTSTQLGTSGTSGVQSSTFNKTSSSSSSGFWGTSIGKMADSFFKSVGWWADGGSFIADGPTVAGFGEAGPELVTAIPLSRVGKGAGKSTPQFADSAGGLMQLEVMLSPDLEYRIMQNTLDETASIVARVRGGKYDRV